MSATEGSGPYKLLLESFAPKTAAEIRELVQKLLGVGPGQANDIMESVPIILLDGIASRKKADNIMKKFKEAVDLGAQMKVSDEPLEHTPRLRWPEEPDIAKDEDQEKTEGREEEILTLAKYNFVVDRRNVFRCPGCDRLFIIRELTGDEAQEAGAQAEIAERLQKQVTSRPAAVPQARQPVTGTTPEKGVEEVEPMQDAQPQAGMLSSSDADIIDLATFEEGLSSIEYESPEVPELALPPDTQPASSEVQAQDFFQELESLPVEGNEEPEPAGEAPSPEAAQKESELEELGPEEAMKFFKGRRAKSEEESEQDEKKKVVAPRRGAGRRRMQHLRDKQDDKGEKRRPSGRRKRAREEPEDVEPTEEVEHTEGFHGVVLSRIGSKDKRNKAAMYVVELTGMHIEEARDICMGTFVNVIKGISEEEANEIAGKFKEMGVSAKVTLQKRKKRQSERMQKRR